jgi:uncharacterized membrane protein YphA (DoxX/SURF4 family)
MPPTTVVSAGLLVLRLVVGVTFLVHGLDKLGDLSGTEQFFASLNIPAADLMAPFVALTETAGGLLLIAGLATPLVGAALAVDMLVALVTAHIDHRRGLLRRRRRHRARAAPRRREPRRRPHGRRALQRRRRPRPAAVLPGSRHPD